MKYFIITMKDGSKWGIPVHIIAKSRAICYANSNADKTGRHWDDVYREEYESTIENDLYIIGWATGNMNWSDVKEFAISIQQSIMTDSDFQEGWLNGDKSIQNINEDDL